jgi:glucuronoarabinoxylan endo-1,4-beta-xylanase
VDFAAVRQTMDGFGASDAYHGAFDDAQADLFFSPDKGIGLSLLRVLIQSEGQYDREAWSNAAKAAARGARVWGSPWSPSEVWKTTGDERTGSLRASSYEEWATLLAAFGLQLKARTGVDLYAVSVQNEPDHDTKGEYDMCLWDAASLREFIKVLGPKLAVLHPRPKLMAPEPSGWHNLWTDRDYMGAIAADPVALGYLDIVGTHQYDFDVVAHPLPRGKPLWQTEMSGFDGPDTDIQNGVTVAKWIHTAIVTGSASAWHYWWLFGRKNDNQGLINRDGSIPKRLYTLGNYSKFIRPGFVHVDTRGGAPGLYLSAYKGSEPGAFVVVAINDTGGEVELTLTLEGLSSDAAVPWMTTATLNLARQPSIPIVRGHLTTRLPAMASVVTLVGRAR